MTIFKKIFSSTSKKSDAERVVRLIYFGLLHRSPEAPTLRTLISKIVSGMTISTLLESVMRSGEFRQQLSLKAAEDYLSLLPLQDHNCPAEAFKFVGSDKKQNIKNIIYLSPAISWPVGGIKVLFRHSELINRTAINHASSEIYFPEAPDFDINWFEHKAKIKRDPTINIDNDFIVLPEIFALKFGAVLKKTT